eukprot:9900928-Lingulodinium_polyedra.AAC.1
MSTCLCLLVVGDNNDNNDNGDGDSDDDDEDDDEDDNDDNDDRRPATDDRPFSGPRLLDGLRWEDLL